MRLPLLTVLTALLCATLPNGAAAQGAASPQKAWEGRVFLLTRVSATAPVCHLTGYTFDSDGATAALETEIADAPKSGLTVAQAEAYATTQTAKAKADVAVLTANLDNPDPDVSFKAFRDVFQSAATGCKNMAAASPYLKPGAFQASGLQLSFENYIAFQAETGTVEDMIRAIDFYRQGYIADPDYTKGVALTVRAAEKRHPKAAFYMAANHISGKGAEKSFEKGLMWAIIADRLGYADAAQVLPDIRASVSPAVATRAEADATAWLKAH